MDQTASDNCKENQQQVDANNFISNFDRAKGTPLKFSRK